MSSALANVRLLRKSTYLLALAVLFGWAAWRRFSLPQTPIADNDYAYLMPALSKLNGGPFQHVGAVNCIYPGLVYFVVRVFGDFRALAIFQHTLGLVAGALFLLAWNRAADFFPGSRLPPTAHRIVGLTGVTIYLFSNHPIVFECQIRPDAICMFLAILLIWLATQFCFYRFVAVESRKLICYATITIFVGCVLAAVKPSFMLASGFILAPVNWLTITSAVSAAKKLAVVATLGVVLAGLSILQSSFARDESLSAMFLPRTLFVVHAKIIQKQMTTDLVVNGPGPTSKEWLRGAAAELQHEIETSQVRDRRDFPSLGFNPDSLNSGDDPLLDRWGNQLGDETFLRFLRYWYGRALVRQPLAFGRKILDQLQIFYSTECPAFYAEKRVPLAPRYYAASFAALNYLERWPQLWRAPAAIAFHERTDRLRTAHIVIEERRAIDLGKKLFRRSYLAILLATVFLASWVLVRRKNSSGLIGPAFLVFVFYSANFGNVLGISIVHSMDVLRYSTVQFLGALFAELFAIRWLAEFFLTRWLPNRDSRSG